MKKRILALLGAVMMLTGCGSEETVTPTETTPAQVSTTDPVYSGEMKTVWVHDEVIRTDASGSYRTDYVYREDNTLSDVVMYDADGKEQQRYQVTCDRYGNPVQWTMGTEDGNTTVDYTFDDRGNMTKTEVYGDSSLLSTTENIWSGDLRVSTTVKAQGIEQRTEYTFDEKGLAIRQDLYVDGILTAYAICTNDDQGRILVSQGYDLKGNKDTAVTYTYADNLETRVTTDKDGEVLRTQTIEYDEHGNMIKTTVVDTRGTAEEVHSWIAVEVPVESPRAGM